MHAPENGSAGQGTRGGWVRGGLAVLKPGERGALARAAHSVRKLIGQIHDLKRRMGDDIGADLIELTRAGDHRGTA